MRYNTTVPKALLPYYQEALANYSIAYKKGHLETAWQYLERAHIIGQRYPYAHTLVHWKMLQFGCKIKSRKEILGQIPRLVFGGVKSFVGKIPVGNPGGANVPPLRSFPIEKELQDIFVKAGVALD
ncbi:DUF3703 domain-containing protein [Dokdonia ponticola]|uniref:DUF3703 domain-containing protein n=1 Tax=Dokdonia ponticola TaxID=2041041 RepID=A0ABV9HUQ7_9FLAO